jgi:hypothetical protein
MISVGESEVAERLKGTRMILHKVLIVQNYYKLKAITSYLKNLNLENLISP